MPTVNLVGVSSFFVVLDLVLQSSTYARIRVFTMYV